MDKYMLHIRPSRIHKACKTRCLHAGMGCQNDLGNILTQDIYPNFKLLVTP